MTLDPDGPSAVLALPGEAAGRDLEVVRRLWTPYRALVTASLEARPSPRPEAELASRLTRESNAVLAAMSKAVGSLQANGEKRIRILVLSQAAGIGCILLMGMGMLILLERTVTRPLHFIRGHAREISAGQTCALKPALFTGELRDLADTLCHMVDRLAASGERDFHGTAQSLPR